MLRVTRFAVALLLSQVAFPGQNNRGEYLAKHVAMCVQCHSPRDDQGKLIEQRLFMGAPIPIQGPYPTGWAFRAPRISGLPGWTDEDFIRLLETGKKPDGTSPKRPMPPFRMNREDAAAIGSFLKSLYSSH